MHKYERYGLWTAVSVLAVVALLNYNSLGGIDEKVTDYGARLDKPVVTANVIPGVPTMLSEAWTTATEEADLGSMQDHVWLTLRLTNQGYSPAGEVIATMSTVPAISGVYAYANDGDTLEASYGGPDIAEGGAGEQMVSAEFSGNLDRGESHLMFVAFAPTTFGTAPYTQDAQQRWASLHSSYWNSVTVTAAEDSWADEKTEMVSYGLGSAGMPATAQQDVPDAQELPEGTPG